MANSQIRPDGIYDDNYNRGGVGSTLSSIDPAQADNINKYVADLKATSQQNYDFVVKYLKTQHEQALGANDQARATFLEQVANTYEKQVGRIPFDYETKTTREKQDIANYLKSSELMKQDALTREKQFGEQQGFEKKQEQKQLSESMNTRGLLNSGIQKGESNKLALARQLFTEDPFYRQISLEKTQRTEADRLKQIQSDRNLFDITTGARRDALDTQSAFEKGTAGAALDKAQADKLAEQKAEIQRRDALKLIAEERMKQIQ